MAKITDMFHQKMESIRHKIKKEDSPAVSDEEEKTDQPKEVSDDELYGKMNSINQQGQPDQEQSPDGDNSDTDVEIPDEISDEDKARMLKRKWIILGGSAAGVFVAFMMLANFMNADNASKQEKDPPLKSTDIAAGNSAKPTDPSNGIPGKYSDIQKYASKNTDNKTPDAKKIAPKSTSTSSTSSSNVYSNYPHTTSTSSSSNSSRPSDIEVYERDQAARQAQAVAAPRQTEADRAALRAEQKRQQQEESAYESAIRFALAANPSASGSNASTANVSTSNAVSKSVTTSSYSVSDGSEVSGTYALQAGSVIQATLITGITTDMANADVVAQVRQNIYDSQTGEHLLIPQGSRLIGTSGSAGSRGNARVGVTFTRLIYPDGHDVALPSQKAIDGVGYAGLKDQYTEHTGKLYSTAFVTALLSAAAQSATGNSSGSDDRSPGQEAVSGAVADVLDSMRTIIDRQGQVQPTATIRPGTQFSVFINQDLMLEEYSE